MNNGTRYRRISTQASSFLQTFLTQERVHNHIHLYSFRSYRA